MDFFSTPHAALTFMKEELLASLRDDLNRMNSSDKGHYSGEDRLAVHAKIADIEAIADAVTLKTLPWTVTCCASTGNGGHFSEVINAYTAEEAMEAGRALAAEALGEDAGNIHVIHVINARVEFVHYDDSPWKD